METNNKLIAEFLGYIDNGCSEEGFLIDPETNYDVCIDSLQFHTDWNWLMQVVEKIETHGFTFDIKKNWSCITRKGERIVIRWEEDNNKIEAVYNACVEFIKWYNENSAKEK